MKTKKEKVINLRSLIIDCYGIILDHKDLQTGEIGDHLYQVTHAKVKWDLTMMIEQLHIHIGNTVDHLLRYADIVNYMKGWHELTEHQHKAYRLMVDKFPRLDIRMGSAYGQCHVWLYDSVTGHYLDFFKSLIPVLRRQNVASLNYLVEPLTTLHNECYRTFSNVETLGLFVPIEWK